MSKFLITYFSANVYVPISIFIFLLILIINNMQQNTLNANEMLEDIRNELLELKKTDKKLSNLLEYIINQALEGNRTPIYILIFTLSLIPVFRIMMLISVIKSSN